MAVGVSKSGQVHDIKGIKLASICANIRYKNRRDLVIIEIADGATVAGVFTRNAFCAAPVKVCQQHLQKTASRYFLINTGNANAGTGEAGAVDALRCCQSLADLARVDMAQVLPFSTGVIGERLPVDKILTGLPAAFTALAEHAWLDAARGIMTTDTRPKLASRKVDLKGKTLTITGMAKGAGMLKPNMATMLAYVFTDASIEQPLLASLLTQSAEVSFNRITVDGDTSTNDSCMLVATGKGDVSVSEADAATLVAFTTALNELMIELATGLIRDAEGATKFVTLSVTGGQNASECLKVAYAVAESPLVKTALFASDPNWGRILAAVGRAGVENLDVNGVSIHLDEVCIVDKGMVSDSYTEARGQQVMDKDEIRVIINLGRGDHVETVWTSDLSQDYVRINAEYRS